MEETFPEKNTLTTPSVEVSTSDGHLHLHEFSSRIFHNKRMLRVWVPSRYDFPENAEARYPVFYLNDGQNLFESSTSFTGVEWEVDETASRMIAQGFIPPMIFVGIDNARQERLKEYIPYRSLNPLVLRPQGAKYSEFLLKEVMPFIAQRYRVAGGPENTAVGGSSLGGLISLHLATAAPGVFGRLLLESPSLWVANCQALEEARRFREWPEKVWIGVGTSEAGRADKDRRTVENVRELERSFRRAGLNESRLHVEVTEGGTHSEGAWAARFPAALAFLFGKLG
jgi:predicted alpha/beta superfamily hydrolase